MHQLAGGLSRWAVHEAVETDDDLRHRLNEVVRDIREVRLRHDLEGVARLLELGLQIYRDRINEGLL